MKNMSLAEEIRERRKRAAELGMTYDEYVASISKKPVMVSRVAKSKLPLRPAKRKSEKRGRPLKYAEPTQLIGLKVPISKLNEFREQVRTILKQWEV